MKKTILNSVKFGFAPAIALFLLPSAGSGQPAAPAVAEASQSPVVTNAGADEEIKIKPTLEVQIYEVTSSNHTRHEKAVELLKMFATQDRQGQRKVALAAVQQVDDADFALIRTHLLDPKLDPRVLSVFMTDTLKRQNSIKLPALLQLAQMNGHPMQEESHQLLVAFLKKDYGTDWPKWDQAISTWLAANPN